MKTYFITIIYIIFACAFSNAQETPTPPDPPSTSSSSSRSVSRSSTQTENTSISISYTDEDYKLRARFPKNRYPKLKALIEKELGGKNMVKTYIYLSIIGHHEEMEPAKLLINVSKLHKLYEKE